MSEIENSRINLTIYDLRSYIYLWFSFLFLSLAYFSIIGELDIVLKMTNTILYLLLAYIVIISTSTKHVLVFYKDFIKIHAPGYLHRFISIVYSDILLISFVNMRYTPLLQAIKKRQFSNIVSIFICYSKGKKIKRIRVHIHYNDVISVRKFFKEKGIKMVDEREFMKYSYNCRKYLNTIKTRKP